VREAARAAAAEDQADRAPGHASRESREVAAWPSRT
jgi:hypothetical protein